MELKQYYLACLSHASYLIADPAAGAAAVVDPQRDIDAYLADAEAMGAKIRHVILTHFHADFLAGHLELARRTGAEIHLGAAAEADYPFTPAADGATIAVGAVRLRVLATPGHTPESISLVVYPPETETPHAVLTGDALFVGDVGRPDLLASRGVTAEELAGQLYASLHERLLALPDATLVYPAHGAGSMCGRSLGSESFSTIGDQRRLNYALQPMTREAFIALVTANQPAAPAYFAYDADLNRRERATLDETLAVALQPLTLEALLRSRNAGAQILDTRPVEQVAAGHLRDSVLIALDGRFATWAGAVLDRTAPIVIVAEPDRAQETAVRLGRIGFDNAVGFLAEGAAAFARAPELCTTLERVAPEAVARLLEGERAAQLLDVRTIGEWSSGHLPDALHIPLTELNARLDEVATDRPLVVYCRTGYRSVVAASVLRRAGRRDVRDIEGGWEAFAPLLPQTTEAGA